MIPITDEQAMSFLVRGVDKDGYSFYNTYPCKIDILTDDPLIIGFDQSTAQTGMSIKTTSGEFEMIVDLINKTSMPQAVYEQMMLIVLQHTFKGKKVELVVIEKPFGQKSKLSFEAMIKLKGFMETLMYTVPEFRGVKLGEIYPQTWRKGFLASKEYAGRKKKTRDLKDCAREETAKRYPITYAYVYQTGAPPDSCDAVGVLDGYLEANYSNGHRIINTTMQANYQVKYDYMIALLEPGKLIEYFKEHNPKTAWFRGVDTLQYNTELSLQNNCQRAVAETNNLVCLAVTDVQHMSIFMWESGIEYEPGKLYYLITWRVNIDEKYGKGQYEDLYKWGLTLEDFQD